LLLLLQVVLPLLWTLLGDSRERVMRIAVVALLMNAGTMLPTMNMLECLT
jgi:hypothetical protein